MSGDNVVDWGGVSRIDTSAERIIELAADASLVDVVIVGMTADGSEYFGSSCADGANALWHLERGKHRLLKIIDDMAE
jgi:hypothetical protein